MAEVTSKHG